MASRGAYKNPAYALRIPQEIKDTVAIEAKAHRWSINTWINVAIEEKLEREKKNAAA